VLSTRTEISTEVLSGEPGIPLSPTSEFAFRRILQEALTNIARHSHAGHVTVTLERSDAAVTCSVKDDGAGFDATCNGRPHGIWPGAHERAGGGARRHRGHLLERVGRHHGEVLAPIACRVAPAGRDTVNQDPPKIRLLVADDERVFRHSLTDLLAMADDVEIVGEAGDGLDAVELAVDRQADVIFMDIGMPRLDGIAATRRLAERRPDIKVVILTILRR
jgi:hypothetical protein